MSTLDSTILDFIEIGSLWALNATVMFFSAMVVISGMLHLFWCILEGFDNRVFFPKNLADLDITETEIQTPTISKTYKYS